jgi:hypothetical protein
MAQCEAIQIGKKDGKKKRLTFRASSSGEGVLKLTL